VNGESIRVDQLLFADDEEIVQELEDIINKTLKATKPKEQQRKRLMEQVGNRLDQVLSSPSIVKEDGTYDGSLMHHVKAWERTYKKPEETRRRHQAQDMVAALSSRKPPLSSRKPMLSRNPLSSRKPSLLYAYTDS